MADRGNSMPEGLRDSMLSGKKSAGGTRNRQVSSSLSRFLAATLRSCDPPQSQLVWFNVVLDGALIRTISARGLAIL